VLIRKILLLIYGKIEDFITKGDRAWLPDAQEMEIACNQITTLAALFTSVLEKKG